MAQGRSTLSPTLTLLIYAATRPYIMPKYVLILGVA